MNQIWFVLKRIPKHPSEKSFTGPILPYMRECIELPHLMEERESAIKRAVEFCEQNQEYTWREVG